MFCGQDEEFLLCALEVTHASSEEVVGAASYLGSETPLRTGFLAACVGFCLLCGP